MRPRGRGYFWTVLGTVAGVVGAAAAMYSILSTDQHDAHVTSPNYLDGPDFVWVQSLSDTVILTGNWFIKHGKWWNARTLLTGNVVGLGGLTDLRVAANDRKLVSIDGLALERWAGGRLEKCYPGDFEIGIEYKSKSGLSWARTALHFCVRAAEVFTTKNLRTRGSRDANWPKDWPSIAPQNTPTPDRQ